MNLPIDQIEDEFRASFSSLEPGGRIVLTAPTGSGKSTRVPVWCCRPGRKVLVVEPRRVAARTLAEWVARGRGEQVGRSVGYTVRFENRSRSETEIHFVTPGVARRFLTDGVMSRYGTVIFDEFHERGWETDTLLALLAAQRSDEAPRLVIMSATLVSASLVDRYGAKLLEAHGRTFPVDVSYQQEGTEVSGPSKRDLTERAARAVREAWAREGGGSLLVFLPGLSSMHGVAAALAGLPVVLLHGTYSQKEQARAFVEEERRVVLATNVAESSLTIPGVTTVIDSGLERRKIHQSGYVALATVPVARSSADQRAGRAGRERPGTCVRLWSRQARLEATRPPELRRMELDDLVMFMASLPEGLSTPAEWLDEPPHFAWERARDRLQENGLLTASGHLSPLGRAAQKLPVEGEWGRLLASSPEELKADLCDLCALATARRNPVKATRSEEVVATRRADWGEERWSWAVNVLRRGDPKRHALDPESLASCLRVAEELRALCEAGAGADRAHPGLRIYLARAWPERLFVLREGRQAWGNGQVECRPARGEEIPEGCLAAFFLQMEPVLRRGLKVELQARWALPVPLSLLRQAGLGEPRPSKVRWSDGQLVAKVVYEYAGRELGSSEEVLRDLALRRALAGLAAAGEWRAQAFERMLEEQFYLALAAALDGEEFSAPAPAELMEERLGRLGVTECSELELLEDEDFLLGTLDEQSWERLSRDYPRLYRFGGLAFEMTYEPRRRRVVMNSLSQSKGVKLSPQHLPRWNGWRVELDERGRRTVLRP